jgi:hypothetical protein
MKIYNYRKRYNRNKITLSYFALEAMDAILLHSPTAESVLLRKRVSREILFKYLHNNGVPTIPTDKGAMVRKILQMWECVPHEEVILSFIDLQ